MHFFTPEQIVERNLVLNARAVDKYGVAPGRPERDISATDAQIETFNDKAPTIAHLIIHDMHRKFDKASPSDLLTGSFNVDKYLTGLPIAEKELLEEILTIAIIAEAKYRNFVLDIVPDKNGKADSEVFNRYAKITIRLILPVRPPVYP